MKMTQNLEQGNIRIQGIRSLVQKKHQREAHKPRWDDRFHVDKMQEYQQESQMRQMRKNKVEMMKALKEKRSKLRDIHGSVQNLEISEDLQHRVETPVRESKGTGGLQLRDQKNEILLQDPNTPRGHNLWTDDEQEKASAVHKLRKEVAKQRQHKPAYSAVINAIQNREQQLKEVIDAANEIDQEQELVEEDFLNYEQLLINLRLTSIVVAEAVNKSSRDASDQAYLEKIKSDYLDILATPLGKYFYIIEEDPFLIKSCTSSQNEMGHLRPIPLAKQHFKRAEQAHLALYPEEAVPRLKSHGGKRGGGREEVVRKKGSTRHSKSQYGDDRSLSSQSKRGGTAISQIDKKIIQAYMPPLSKGVLKKINNKQVSRTKMLQPTKSETRLKNFQQGVHSSYFNHPRVGSMEQSPSSVKSVKSSTQHKLLERGKQFPKRELNIYTNIRVGRKASQHRVLPGNSIRNQQKVYQSPRSKSQPAHKVPPKYVYDQDQYTLEPLDVEMEKLESFLQEYVNKLDRGMRETQLPMAEVLKEIGVYGFESVFLKLVGRDKKHQEGLVVITNDSSSYLRRRVKLLHLSVITGEEGRGFAFKRLVEMALGYIWKYTLADEIKLELQHFRPEPGEDLQPDLMVKNILKEQNFRWKNLVNQKGKRGEVMGVNRAEIETVRKDEDPEQEPVLLNLALRVCMKPDEQIARLPPKGVNNLQVESLQAMGYAQFIGKIGEKKEEGQNAEEDKEEKGEVWEKALEAKFKLPASKVVFSEGEGEEVHSLFQKHKINFEKKKADQTMGIVCSLSSRWQSYEVANIKGQNYLRLTHFKMFRNDHSQHFYLLETDDDAIKYVIVPLRAGQNSVNYSDLFEGAEEVEDRAKELWLPRMHYQVKNTCFPKLAMQIEKQLAQPDSVVVEGSVDLRVHVPNYSHNGVKLSQEYIKQKVVVMHTPFSLAVMHEKVEEKLDLPLCSLHIMSRNLD